MCLRSMSWVRATKVASAPSASDTGLNGWSSDPNGDDFVTFPISLVGEYWPFVKPVDLVVEQQHREVHVAPQRMDQVVAADRQRVAVAGDDPHVEVGTGERHAGGDRRRAAVDAVQAVRVHVVREPGGAPDAGDEHEVLRASRRARAGAAAPRRGWSSRRTPGTTAPPGRTGSPCASLTAPSGSRSGLLVRTTSRHRASPGSRLRSRPPERGALDLGEAPGVDEELGPHQARQLAQVHLGHQDLRVAGEDLAEVGGERVEVHQVGVGDVVTLRAHAPSRGLDRTPRAAPARARGPRRRARRRPRPARRRWRCGRSSRPGCGPSARGSPGRS